MEELKFEEAYTYPDCKDFEAEEFLSMVSGWVVVCEKRFRCKNHNSEKCEGIKKEETYDME